MCIKSKKSIILLLLGSSFKSDGGEFQSLAPDQKRS